MRKIIIIAIICLLLIQINKLQISKTSITVSPDTIVTNNNVVNYYENIDHISEQIDNDNYLYSFKKEEIIENLQEFKIVFIDTLNALISNKNYIEAQNLLDKYAHFYPNDAQINSLNNYISTTIQKSNLVEYKGEIEVLSFNPLIAYPKIIFHEKNSSSLRLDEEHITIDEFEKIINSLYEKNYVLISPTLLLNIENDYPKLFLPHNKKPLILILEDVEYNSQNGCVDKLIIDNNNQVATYTPKLPINDRIQRNNDFITILENFVKTHPSFSHNNAKALIVVDGSKGLFGYKTQKTNATSKYEIKKAVEIINYLKNNGYSFASEGYNTTINNTSISFASGLNTWNNEIVPILGSTEIFFLNANINSINTDIGYQTNLLKSYNYNLIIGSEMDSDFYFNEKLKSYYITAKQINGKSLRYSQDKLSHLFDCEKIYDHINRNITFNI